MHAEQLYMDHVLEPNRLYEQVAAEIEAKILGGDLRPNDQLPSERDLAKQFDVSRTVVREAIKMLREKGLIEVHLGRGTFVINRTPHTARRSLNLALNIGQASGWRDLVEVRTILEPEIAALAARRATQEHIAALQKTIEALGASAGDLGRAAEADTDFHIILAEASGNAAMSILLDPMLELVHDQRRRLFWLDERIKITQVEHKRIVDAITRRDPDAARKAMRGHLQRVQQDVEIIVDQMERGV